LDVLWRGVVSTVVGLLLHAYQRPEKPNRGSIWPADRFRSAAQEAKICPDKDIPHISAPIIINLQLLGLL
jgi:fatty acid CoA ligase FadD9